MDKNYKPTVTDVGAGNARPTQKAPLDNGGGATADVNSVAK